MGEGLWQASRCLHNLKKALYAFSTGEVTRNAVVYEIEGWIMLFCHGYGGRSCGKEHET